MSKQTRKPWKKLTFYPVSLTIWDREVTVAQGETRTMYSLVISKCYKDDAGRYQNTDNLSPDDAAKATVLLQKGIELTVLEG